MRVGGMSPSREPVGKTGSAACAGIAESASAIMAAKPRDALIERVLIACLIICFMGQPMPRDAADDGVSGEWVRHPGRVIADASPGAGSD